MASLPDAQISQNLICTSAGSGRAGQIDFGLLEDVTLKRPHCCKLTVEGLGSGICPFTGLVGLL
eukprot:5694280-Amphidinium_carterae.1